MQNVIKSRDFLFTNNFYGSYKHLYFRGIIYAWKKIRIFIQFLINVQYFRAVNESGFLIFFKFNN